MARMDELLRCRDIGHHWEENFGGYERRRGAPWGTRRILLCTSCGMERNELVNTQGEAMSRHYDRPNDYGKVSKLTKNEARKKRIQRRKGSVRHLQAV